MFSIHKKQEYQKILYNLEKNGIVIVKNIFFENELLYLAKKLGKIYNHPHSSKNGITYINKKLKDTRNVDSGFLNNKLLLHTDRGITTQLPPKYLILHCQKQAKFGGDNLFVDGYKILPFIKKYKKFYQYCISNNDIIYNNGIEQYNGAIIENFKNEIIFRIYLDKRVIKNTYFYKNIKILTKILNKHLLKIKLNKGDTVIFNNRRFIHGRTSFMGYRSLLRILVN